MNMENKAAALMRMIVLLLGFSYVFSCVAIPSTRILKSFKQNPPSTQDLLAQDGIIEETNIGSEEDEMGNIDGRMLLVSTDYPGTGANNHHDPKTPGRA